MRSSGRCSARRDSTWRTQICRALCNLAPVSLTAAWVLVAGMLPAGALGVSAPQPAAWIAFDLVVHLRDLPRRDSCAEISQKLRDVLLAIGARQENVFAYRCEQGRGRAMPARQRFTRNSRFRKCWAASHGENRPIYLWCARPSNCSRDILPPSARPTASC